MANPIEAPQFPEPMDPYDEVDFVADFATGDGVNPPLLDSGETIAAYTVTLSPEATAVGLTIMNSGLHVTSLESGNTKIKLWLTVSVGEQANAAYDGEGSELGVIFSITTSSSPARKRQRTSIVTVRQR